MLYTKRKCHSSSYGDLKKNYCNRIHQFKRCYPRFFQLLNAVCHKNRHTVYCLRCCINDEMTTVKTTTPLATTMMNKNVTIINILPDDQNITSPIVTKNISFQETSTIENISSKNESFEIERKIKKNITSMVNGSKALNNSKIPDIQNITSPKEPINENISFQETSMIKNKIDNGTNATNNSNFFSIYKNVKLNLSNNVICSERDGYFENVSDENQWQWEKLLMFLIIIILMIIIVVMGFKLHVYRHALLYPY